MREMFDATWRALAYCLLPQVMLRGLLPLALAGGLVLAAGWYGWESAVGAVRALLEEGDLLPALFEWLEAIGVPDWRPVLAPMMLVAIALPAVVMATLLVVAWVAAPAITALVARRRFPQLHRSPVAAGRAAALGWSLACAAFALVALVLSVPLWFVPPLVLVLPPLIWGWLCFRVLAFDALARHAGTAERRFILYHHRWPLRLAGLAFGVMAALPSLLWAAGAMVVVLAPWLMLGAVWAYTVVFVFASLWYAHYSLSALQRLRQAAAVMSYVHESRFAP